MSTGHTIFPWVIRLARADASSLAGLRLMAGLEVAESDREIWLRGKTMDERLAGLIAAVPANDRYEWIPPQQLRPLNRRIPGDTLPALAWQPLAAWLQVEFPSAALPGLAPRPASLRLERSAVEHEPAVLLTTLDAFHAFVARAPRVRLERLRFAANAAGEVLVRGAPLPPLPGRRFVLHGGLAVPAGFTWQPAGSAEVVARCLGATEDTLTLWHEDGTIARLHTEQFLAVTPGAVHATATPPVETP